MRRNSTARPGLRPVSTAVASGGEQGRGGMGCEREGEQFEHSVSQGCLSRDKASRAKE